MLLGKRESASIKCVNYRAHQHKGANKRNLMIAQLSAIPSPSTFYLVVKCAIKGMVIGCERISFSLMHCHGAPGTSLHTPCVWQIPMLFRDSSPREKVFETITWANMKRNSNCSSRSLCTQIILKSFLLFDQRADNARRRTCWRINIVRDRIIARDTCSDRLRVWRS